MRQQIKNDVGVGTNQKENNAFENALLGENLVLGASKAYLSTPLSYSSLRLPFEGHKHRICHQKILMSLFAFRIFGLFVSL